LKIVLGAFHSCGRRERRFEASSLRERIRLETLSATSELLKFGQLYISLLLQRHRIAPNCGVRESKRDSKCINVRLASTYRDKVYPCLAIKLARIYVCMHAMPWTVPDAHTGPGFSYLTFFLGSWNQQNQNPEKKITRKSVLFDSKPWTVVNANYRNLGTHGRRWPRLLPQC
jgi:hypothetical protein